MIDNHHLHPAFVLHRRAYSNTSLLLDCFTLPAGRLPLIAKGAKRAGSTRAALLQPFIPLLMNWSGRGEIKTLRSCEAAAPAYDLRGKALYCGFYLNELLVRMLQREAPYEQLFGVYSKTLEQLCSTASIEPVLRYFEIELLQQMGLGLMLEKCAEDDSPIIPDRRYHYMVEVGPIPYANEALATVHGRTLLALAQGVLFDSESIVEARAMMRGVLKHYLGDRPLKSRELFRMGR